MALTHKRRALGFFACAVASSLWGCGFFFGKIALAEMSFAHMVLYRFLFAMVALVPLLATHRPGLTAKEWGILAAASFLGVPVQFLIQFYGLSLTTVSHAAAGVAYVLDVLQWVPYAGVLVGGYGLGGGTIQGTKVLAGAAFALGLDYRVSRSLCAGVTARQHMLTEPNTYPSYTQLFAKFEYTFGW